jgi:hypothetical protein
VLYLVLSPYAVFLFAGYSEALFLACALWGWLCARREQWVPAALLVAAAASVRVSGLFLACGWSCSTPSRTGAGLGRTPSRCWHRSRWCSATSPTCTR